MLTITVGSNGTIQVTNKKSGEVFKLYFTRRYKDIIGEDGRKKTTHRGWRLCTDAPSNYLFQKQREGSVAAENEEDHGQTTACQPTEEVFTAADGSKRVQPIPKIPRLRQRVDAD